MKEKKSNQFWELASGKLFNETDQTDETHLKELLQEEKNQNDFRQLSAIHEKLAETKPLTELSRKESWTRIQHYLQKKKIRLWIAMSKYAAAIIVAFIIGTLVNINWNTNHKPVQFTEINVPLGQMSNITLYDGTQVWLNSGTTLKYAKDFGEKNRKVSLDGEAFFKVKHGEIPFKVRLKNSEIKVFGTSFNVVSFSDEDFSQVTLVEGSVQMNTTTGKEITRMKPSQQLTISNDLKDIHLKTVKTGFYKSWTEGKIVFREERLSDITPRLERWYNVDIRFKDSEIGKLRFSGTILKNKPFDQIMKAFELLLPVKIEYRNNIDSKDVIIISKKEVPM